MTEPYQIGRRALLRAMPVAAAAAAVAPLPSLGAAAAARPTSGGHWQASWGRALVANEQGELIAANSTYRETIRSSIGGSGLKVVLSNEHGFTPLPILKAVCRNHGIATAQPITFGGLAAITIPPGATVVSDAIAGLFAANESVELSLIIGAEVRAATAERRARPTGGLIAAGDQSQLAELNAARDIAPVFIKSLLVEAASPVPTLVVLSDTKSAGPETWTPMLAAKAGGRLAVVNRSVYAGHLALGPAGASALARFDRDVLATTGATHVLIFTGNNDLIQPGMLNSRGQASLDPSLAMSADALIALIDQCVARTRAAGLIAVGGTWLPYEGVTIAEGYSTPEKLAKRDAVNAWIRSPGSFDVVLDFDQALRDPARPSRLHPAFDEGNHFTPNAAGYALMADTVLRTF